MISEAQIVENCQKGDLEEFGKLYDKYIKKIYDFIYYKTQHKETAEDLTSIVFTKALEGIGRFDKNGKFSSWVYRIARNTVIDHYRTKKSDANIDDIWDLAVDDPAARRYSGASNVEVDLDAREKLEEIRRNLKKLKSEQRDIVIMRVWQEMSYAKIAEVVGKSEASCKMTFSRTIQQLRAEMPLELFILFAIFAFIRVP